MQTEQFTQQETLNEKASALNNINAGDDVRIYYDSEFWDTLSRKTATVVDISHPLGKRRPSVKIQNNDGKFRIKYIPEKNKYAVKSLNSGEELGDFRKIVRTRNAENKPQY